MSLVTLSLSYASYRVLTQHVYSHSPQWCGDVDVGEGAGGQDGNYESEVEGRVGSGVER